MTQCNQCGDCCVNIPLNTTKTAMRQKLREGSYSERGAADARFILAHWTVVQPGSQKTQRFACDQFNRKTRLCMAHDERPNVCRDFPWYGRDAKGIARFAASYTDESPVLSSMRCSFWRDVPKVLWPPNAQPVTLRQRRAGR